MTDRLRGSFIERPVNGCRVATYADLCRLDRLQVAIDQVRANARGDIAGALEAELTDAGGEGPFLEQLHVALVNRTHLLGVGAVASNRVVQAAVSAVLLPLFPPSLPCDASPEAVVGWVADAIGRGYTLAFAMNLEPCVGPHCSTVVTDEFGRRGVDAELLALTKAILATAVGDDPFRAGPLVRQVADALYVGVDAALRQLADLGREGALSRVLCVRWGHELVVLSVHDRRYDWLLPAAHQRIRSDLVRVQCHADAALIQSVDLSSGTDKLSLFGHSLSIGGRGRVVAQRHSCVPSRPARVDDVRTRRSRRLGLASLHVVRRQVSRVVVGATRMLPWLRLRAAWERLRSAQVKWKPIAGVAIAAPSYIRRRVPIAAGVAGVAMLVVLLAANMWVQAGLSGETVAPRRPPGFFIGQYNRNPPFDRELLPYGLYVPPHFRSQRGPFPLIVFLHGYGERSMREIFSAGVPLSIATRFGDTGREGRFNFIALFPIDPTGQWEVGTPEVDDALEVIDYVISRHGVDPDRVYLTGISNGGSGVWRLAEACPDRWAAVAPLGSFHVPDVGKVCRIPCWMFHGEKDDKAPVAPQRMLAKRLKSIGTDVRYTEIVGKGHTIFTEVYDTKDVYDWMGGFSRRGR